MKNSDSLKEMNKFLETYNLPTLNLEEIENLENSPIMSKETESVIKKHRGKKNKTKH